MSSLGIELPEELARCRKLLPIYKQIGLAGIPALTMLENTITKTDKAMIEGDTVVMINCYKELQMFTD